MAEWLKRVITEVDRQYDELPDWLKQCGGERGEDSAVMEPKD